VVGGPKQAFDEKGAKEIDKFLMTGKGAVILADGMAMSSPGGAGMHGMENMQIKMAQGNEHGLDKLLEGYGFKIGKDFVFDKQAAPGLIDMGGRKMLANAPFFAVAETESASTSACCRGSAAWSSPSPAASACRPAGQPASRRPASCGGWPARRRRPGSRPGFFVLGGDPRQIELTSPRSTPPTPSATPTRDRCTAPSPRPRRRTSRPPPPPAPTRPSRCAWW
jgi:hypothetical protein